MNDETRKTVLVAYQKRKQSEIIHPYTGKKMPIGLLFFMQSLLFVRFVLGDMDDYPAFIWR